MRRASTLVAVAVAALVGSVVAAGSPASGGLGSPSGSETFSYTGDVEDFVVPADVCEVTIEAWGAQGGEGESLASASAVPPITVVEVAEPGNRGGYAKATVPVTPGETLEVRVGGAGGDGAVDVGPLDASAGDGGWPDGGDGRADAIAILGFAAVGVQAGSGGGGGSSDVRRGGAGLEHRVVVAGGGGGAGAFGVAAAAVSDGGVNILGASDTATDTSGGAPQGGGGGGTVGVDGDTGSGVASASVSVPVIPVNSYEFTGVTPAGGGTQSAGGAAGTGATAGSPGAGGDGHLVSSSTASGTSFPFVERAAATVGAGGGGGGGYFGGGGGGALGSTMLISPSDELGAAAEMSAGGGGGGSGFGPAGVEFDTDVREGDGQVVISWTVDPGCTTAAGPDAVIVPIRFTG